MRDELEGMTVFAAVAEARSLRAAGDRLGVTGAAVSQALRRLEDRLGLALVERTTRSLRLTAAGERLYGALRPALDEVGAAVAALGELRGRPAGPLRISVSSVAEAFLSGEVIAGFLAAHPDVRLEVQVDDGEGDVVAAGFDAGVRLGEVLERDMLAVRVSGEQRQLVVAAPGYLARRGAPAPRRTRASCPRTRASGGGARRTSPPIAGSSASLGRTGGPRRGETSRSRSRPWS